MKRYFLIFALFGTFLSASSFITNMEYGKMLYKNPRGVGCDKCHGEDGEGMAMSIYIKDGKEIELKAPKINDISHKEFEEAFDKKSNLMPVYFLTKEEKALLYYYISSKSKKREGKSGSN